MKVPYLNQVNMLILYGYIVSVSLSPEINLKK